MWRTNMFMVWLWTDKDKARITETSSLTPGHQECPTSSKQPPTNTCQQICWGEPSHSTTTQMERGKPLGFLCSLVASDSATLSVSVHLYQEEILSLIKPQKPIGPLSKPTASLVQMQTPLWNPIRDFLFQSSASLFPFNSCCALIQQEKSGTFKRKQKTEHNANKVN